MLHDTRLVVELVHQSTPARKKGLLLTEHKPPYEHCPNGLACALHSQLAQIALLHRIRVIVSFANKKKASDEDPAIVKSGLVNVRADFEELAKSTPSYMYYKGPLRHILSERFLEHQNSQAFEAMSLYPRIDQHGGVALVSPLLFFLSTDEALHQEFGLHTKRVDKHIKKKKLQHPWKRYVAAMDLQPTENRIKKAEPKAKNEGVHHKVEMANRPGTYRANEGPVQRLSWALSKDRGYAERAEIVLSGYDSPLSKTGESLVELDKSDISKFLHLNHNNDDIYIRSVPIEYTVKQMGVGEHPDLDELFQCTRVTTRSKRTASQRDAMNESCGAWLDYLGCISCDIPLHDWSQPISYLDQEKEADASKLLMEDTAVFSWSGELIDRNFAGRVLETCERSLLRVPELQWIALVAQPHPNATITKTSMGVSAFANQAEDVCQSYPAGLQKAPHPTLPHAAWDRGSTSLEFGDDVGAVFLMRQACVVEREPEALEAVLLSVVRDTMV